MSGVKAVRLKVKSEAYPWLNAAASEVNQVWNWCAEYSQSRVRNGLSAPTGFDLTYQTRGWVGGFAKINASSIHQVCIQYATKLRAVRKERLRWRCSLGSRRSLGWVPVKAQCLKRHGNAFRFCGKTFRVFEDARLASWRGGSFAQDSVGDWWLCMAVNVEKSADTAPREAVGVDLGLKTAATTSDGERLESRHGRVFEKRIANAQRRGHKHQAKRLHRKAARCRADAIHKFSTMLVAKYQRIYVGDVSSLKLVKTRMAKSVLDAGWGMLKTQLRYKGENAGRRVEVINESYTSVTCSSCGLLSGPRGVNGLNVRNWICECGASHDRDINAAMNILFRGEASPSIRGNGAQL